MPLNNAGTNFTVIVPDSASLTYGLATPAAIEALSFGSSAGLRVSGGSSLLVTSSTVLRGGITANGGGSAFEAPSQQTVFGGYPTLAASGGGRIAIGASTYAWPTTTPAPL